MFNNKINKRDKVIYVNIIFWHIRMVRTIVLKYLALTNFLWRLWFDYIPSLVKKITKNEEYVHFKRSDLRHHLSRMQEFLWKMKSEKLNLSTLASLVGIIKNWMGPMAGLLGKQYLTFSNFYSAGSICSIQVYLFYELYIWQKWYECNKIRIRNLLTLSCTENIISDLKV